MVLRLGCCLVLITVIIVTAIVAVLTNSISETSKSDYPPGNATGGNCITERFLWECCANYTIENFKLSTCILVRYLAKEYGGEVKVTINDHAIIDEIASLVNPPPFCVDIPYLKKLANVCVQLYDMDYKKTHVSGCARVTANVEIIKLLNYTIGCFNIPFIAEPEKSVVLIP